MQNDFSIGNSSSLIEEKDKIKGENNKKNKNEKKLKLIDRLFTRIFLSSVLLLCLVLCSNFSKLKIDNLLNHNINFMKIGNLFSGSLGFVIPNEKDVTVFSKNSYDYVSYSETEKINHVYMFSTDGIKPLTSGIITKVIKNKNHTYNVYITDSTGVTYGYLNMLNCDYHIYSFVTPEVIIGLANYNESENIFTFDLSIEEKGVYYNYYAKSSD